MPLGLRQPSCTLARFDRVDSVLTLLPALGGLFPGMRAFDLSQRS
jgi:hypothetical protein